MKTMNTISVALSLFVFLIAILVLAPGCELPYDLGNNPHDPLSPDYSPAPPKYTIAYLLGPKTVQLGWVDASLGETGFQVSRSLDVDLNFVPIATLPANTESYVDSDTTLVSGVRYYYRIRGVTPTKVGAYSFVVFVTLP
jgi:hypothetical protein